MFGLRYSDYGLLQPEGHLLQKLEEHVLKLLVTAQFLGLKGYQKPAA